MTEQTPISRLSQSLIDDCCYYRNLAIRLGALPTQMQNDYDRSLCEREEETVDPKDGDAVGNDVSYTEELWGKVERLEVENAELIQRLEELINKDHMVQENDRLREALEFYADPTTYFAIVFVGDPPCGEFLEDGEMIDDAWRPGKLARAVLEGRK